MSLIPPQKFIDLPSNGKGFTGKRVALSPTTLSSAPPKPLKETLVVKKKPSLDEAFAPKPVPKPLSKVSTTPSRYSKRNDDEDEDEDDSGSVDYSDDTTMSPQAIEDYNAYTEAMGDFITYVENKGAIYGAGIQQILGYELATALRTKLIDFGDDNNFKQLMKEFLNQPTMFNLVEGFMLDPTTALVLGARAQLSEMFPVFNVPVDEPKFACYAKGHPIDFSGHLPIVPEVTSSLDVERARLICMVTMEAKYTKTTLTLQKLKNTPEANQYVKVDPRLGEVLKTTKGVHFHANEPTFTAPIIKMFPEPNFEVMKVMTAHIQRPLMGLANGIKSGQFGFPSEEEQITLKGFKKFRAVRSSVADFAKSFEFPFAGHVNPVSTIMKWWFPLQEVSLYCDQQFVIGSSQDQQFGNLMSLFNVGLVQGDLFNIKEGFPKEDATYQPPTWHGANIKVKVSRTFDINAAASEADNYEDDDQGSTSVADELTFEFAQLPPEHIFKWNDKRSLLTLIPENEYGGKSLYSDVYLEPNDDHKEKYPGYTGRLLEYMIQADAYHHYAKLLRDKVFTIITFKCFPQFHETIKDNIARPDFFSMGFIVTLFGGYYMRTYPGARLHNGEHIISIARVKIPKWQLIPTVTQGIAAKNFTTFLTAAIRFKMYHANLIRNSLLISGFTSLYTGDEEYPYKKEEGICLRLVPYTKSEMSASLSHYDTTEEFMTKQETLDELGPKKQSVRTKEDVLKLKKRATASEEDKLPGAILYDMLNANNPGLTKITPHLQDDAID